MGTKDVVPHRDSELLAFARNIDTRLTASPTDYGVTIEIATEYNELFGGFEQAMALLNDPATNSSGNVFVKNQTKDLLVEKIRELGRFIRGNPNVTDENKILLGFHVPSGEPSPVPAPKSAPTIDVTQVRGRTVTVQLHDMENPTKRSKPAGVDGATLFTWVGETLPPSMTDWTLEGQFTRTKVELEFPDTVPVNSKVWISGYWYNPRGVSGPSAEPISTYLNREGVQTEAA